MTRSEQWRRRAAVAAMAAMIAAGTAGANPADTPDTGFEDPDIRLENTEPLFEEPLDISTPMPARSGHGSVTPKFTAGPPPSDWSAKVGIDKRAVLPDAPEQSTGVGWANVTAPGVLTWDKTSVETRVDPDQQGRVGVTLSRSIPVGASLSVTLQNGYAVTQSLAPGGVHTHAAPSTAPGAAPIVEGNHAVRFRVVPSDTIFSFGALSSSTDEKWLRSLSAEQKLFGGPVSVTGAVSETPTGDLSRSLKAGFKKSW